MISSIKRFTSQESRFLWLLAAIQFISFAEFMIIMPLAPTLMRVFEFSPSDFGKIVSSYTLFSAISALVCSTFIDRFDRRNSIIVLFGLFLVATFLCALAWNYWSLLFARSLAGVFSGVLSSQAQALVGDKIEVQRRGEAMGRVFAAYSLATVFGVPIGLVLSNHFGWWAPFLFLGTLGTFIFAIALRILPSARGHLTGIAHSPIRDTLDLIRDYRCQACFILTLLTVLSGFFVFPFLSAYLVANVGVKESELFWIYLLGGSATFITSRLIGRAADLHGTAYIFRLVSFAAMIPILIMTELSQVSLPVVVMVGGLFFVLVSGRMTPYSSLLTQAVPAQMRGRFLSISSAVQNLSAALGSYGASRVVSKGADGALLGYGTSGLIACFLIVCSILWSFKIKLAAQAPSEGDTF